MQRARSSRRALLLAVGVIACHPVCPLSYLISSRYFSQPAATLGSVGGWSSSFFVQRQTHDSRRAESCRRRRRLCVAIDFCGPWRHGVPVHGSRRSWLAAAPGPASQDRRAPVSRDHSARPGWPSFGRVLSRSLVKGWPAWGLSPVVQDWAAFCCAPCGSPFLWLALAGGGFALAGW